MKTLTFLVLGGCAPLLAAPVTPPHPATQAAAPKVPSKAPLKIAAKSATVTKTVSGSAQHVLISPGAVQNATQSLSIALQNRAKSSAKSSATAPQLATTLERLPNGIQFIARPDQLAPIAAISVVIRAGASDETPASAGWRRFLVGAMLRAAPLDASSPEASSPAPMLTASPEGEALSRAAERLGGNIGATVGDDFIEIYAVGPSENAPKLLDLALGLWQHPRLAGADLQAARESSQGQVDADNLDTASKTQAALRSQLFRDARGELSAYGLPDYGTSESLANLTDDRLRELFAAKVAPARATVAVTGQFDAAALRARLAALPPRTGSEPAAPSFAAPKSAAALVVRELPVPSAWVFISYPLAGDTQSDAPALRVLASALGDSGQARLPERLLKNQPLGSQPVASSVAAQFIPRRYAGEMVIFAQTGPQSVERVKNALLDEVRKLRDAPLSASELQSAKTYARGSWSLERQNGRDRAFQTALSPALGGPLDTQFPARLEAVTGAQVQAAAKKYLRAYAVALVMPNE